MLDIPSSFYKAETIDGHFVDETMKKTWACELNLLAKFDEVCRKHNLTYFADYGTLLGTVRHKGFIPWDDDIDVVMLRDEYEKFCNIAPNEFEYPYFFQYYQNSLILQPMAKIRDSRTTAIEKDFYRMPESYNQGIYIDICPLDVANDGTPLVKRILDIANTMWTAIYSPDDIKRLMRYGTVFPMENELIEEYLSLTLNEKYRHLELFYLSHLDKTTKVNYIISELYSENPKAREISWFSDVVYLPFETFEMPCPIGYEELLRHHYGDYNIRRKGASSHTYSILDPDKPYTEYLIKQ